MSEKDSMKKNRSSDKGVSLEDELILEFDKYQFKNNRGETIEIPSKDIKLYKIIQDFPDFNSHTKAIKLQLKYCDPLADGNGAIEQAVQDGYLEIVNILLEDGRVDPSEDDNYIIAEAAYGGHLPIIERLLEDPRV